MADSHRIRWFARVPESDETPDGYLPRTSSMVGSSFGWDARCSCGWETHSGGGTQSYIRREIDDHKWDVANGFWPEESASVLGLDR